MLPLKTLVHVEGLGRDLYPELDIWSLAKPILTGWVKQQFDPMQKNWRATQAITWTVTESQWHATIAG